MPEQATWFEQFSKRYEHDPDFGVEILLLHYNREIRRYMRQHHVTQVDLAEKLGVSQAYISRLLNYNQNLTIRSLALIANALEAEWTAPNLVARNAESHMPLARAESIHEDTGSYEVADIGDGNSTRQRQKPEKSGEEKS